MTINNLPPVRRVVTAIGDDGQSYFGSDGAPPATMTSEGRPGYRSANVWRTSGPSNLNHADTTLEHKGVLPPDDGTVLRVIDFPPTPEDPQEQLRQYEAVFKSMYPDAKHQPSNTRHSGMHITDTIDYAIVLHGEITAIMEKGETVLKAGDVLIQRGTNHAWANRTQGITRVAFVLIDAQGTRPI